MSPADRRGKVSPSQRATAGPINSMFNKAWIYLALILIPLGLIGHVKAWLAISAFLLTVLGVAWWWNRRSLVGIEYERLLGVKRAFPGEVVDLTLRLTNQKLLPLGWLMVEDRMVVDEPALVGWGVVSLGDGENGLVPQCPVHPLVRAGQPPLSVALYAARVLSAGALCDFVRAISLACSKASEPRNI